jgi:hypothetical protein
VFILNRLGTFRRFGHRQARAMVLFSNWVEVGGAPRASAYDRLFAQNGNRWAVSLSLSLSLSLSMRWIEPGTAGSHLGVKFFHSCTLRWTSRKTNVSMCGQQCQMVGAPGRKVRYLSSLPAISRIGGGYEPIRGRSRHCFASGRHRRRTKWVRSCLRERPSPTRASDLRPGRWRTGYGMNFVGLIFRWSASTRGMPTRLCPYP